MRVLLIEDDSDTAQSIELMLNSEGFNVYTADLGKRVSILANFMTTTSS
jgi:two-component system, cell cycle response regulator CtrA